MSLTLISLELKAKEVIFYNTKDISITNNDIHVLISDKNIHSLEHPAVYSENYTLMHFYINGEKIEENEWKKHPLVRETRIKNILRKIWKSCFSKFIFARQLINLKLKTKNEKTIKLHFTKGELTGLNDKNYKNKLRPSYITIKHMDEYYKVRYCGFDRTLMLEKIFPFVHKKSKELFDDDLFDKEWCIKNIDDIKIVQHSACKIL